MNTRSSEKYIPW